MIVNYVIKCTDGTIFQGKKSGDSTEKTLILFEATIAPAGSTENMLLEDSTVSLNTDHIIYCIRTEKEE